MMKRSPLASLKIGNSTMIGVLNCELCKRRAVPKHHNKTIKVITYFQ